MKVVYSQNNVLIRVTNERWNHITKNHDELIGRISSVLDTIANPDIIVKGTNRELLAAKQINEKWVVVVYKELKNIDGFIITAFITSRINYLLKKEIVWKKQL